MKSHYKRMLGAMQEKESRLTVKPKPKRRDKWYLYILRCSDLSFYTGIAKDVAKRFKMHSEGKGARYTRTRRPLEIVYQETCPSRAEALIREWNVKTLSRAKKAALVNHFKNCTR